MKICVIGAGASGLTSIKACKEENVDVVCYERSKYYGGLWCYNEDDPNLATVARSTIINSSKEMSAFSDFVPEDWFPNYMHNTLMFKYFDMYADKFDLKKHIKYRTEVVQVREADDHESTGKWRVTTKNLETEEITIEVFDSVMICTGHHIRPIWPDFKNQHKFKGKLSHSHTYKKPDGFEAKKAVVVGIGNSGGDIAAELSIVAEKVFLSTRKGAWIFNRMSSGGYPIDYWLTRRSNEFLLKYLPSLASSIFEKILENRFDHKMYGLKPKHRVFEQHPTINDSLPNRILSGTVIVKGDIEEFTEEGVLFKGENQVTPVDCVVFATGYEIKFPFLDERLIDIKDNKVDLYKFQYIPHLKHSHTLAIIGLTQPRGALIPISECQARWHLQLVKKKCQPLPSVEQMLDDIRNKKDEIKKRYYDSKRHTIQVDVVPFMDEIAEQFGAKPNLSELFLSDPLLWYHLMFKPSLTYQYRLKGPHSDYQKAREAILSANQRIHNAFKTQNHYDYSSDSLIVKMGSTFLSIFVFFMVLFFY